MRKMRGEVEKKPPTKKMNNSHFYNVTWMIFETLCKVTLPSPFFLLDERTDQ